MTEEALFSECQTEETLNSARAESPVEIVSLRDGSTPKIDLALNLERRTELNSQIQAAMNDLKEAFENVKPQIETKSRRVGGTNYQVPMEVPHRRGTTLAIRWIVDASRKRGEKTMHERLGREILDASKNSGASVKKREDVHKMAESNRAFAHYRW